MGDSTFVLMGTAFTIALLHTAAGPDHYLPFIILGRSKNWSLSKIFFWTAVAGLGHVGSSVLVGTIGIALGASVGWMGWFEGVRGSVAAWGLVALGVAYMSYGVYRGYKDASGYSHTHSHGSSMGEHQHGEVARSKTFWALVLIFVMGPCEPLIPLLMVPAAQYSFLSVVAVALVFGVTTIAAMVALVGLAYAGVTLFEFGFVRRYMHAFSGFAIAASGLLIVGSTF